VAKPSTALIINTCNQPDYLARVLQAVAVQNEFPDEVVIADDGSNDETRRIIAQWSTGQPFHVYHAWQPKKGFRRSRILNVAISQVQSDYLIFLDGDTIPHPDFAADHRGLARRGFFIQGHRVLVSKKASNFFGAGEFRSDRRKAFFSGQLSGLKHIFRWILPFKQIVPDLDGVRGCNLSVWRSDLVKINGYNEEFVGWGCEDLDLALRLMNSGIRRLDVRGHALCYHLWHPLLDRSNLAANQKILDDTARYRSTSCKQGLSAHLPNQSRHGWVLATTRSATTPVQTPACVPLQAGELIR
jgi:glycosyltransferase involved in cell wall biosynthesis